MNIDLTDTTASKISAAILEARRRSGSPATGAVLTLVIVTDEQGHYDALKAATSASREHPSRILVVVARPGRGDARLDAEVRTSGETGPGEVVLLRLHGELAHHPDSVVLPLLLPDAPVVAWWPGTAPQDPSAHPIGALAQRRITDAASCDDPLAELAERARGYSPGDTDLSWTRLTQWRTFLAGAFDQVTPVVHGATVESEPDSPSAELLARWVEARLGVQVARVTTDGPGITGVRLDTDGGQLTLLRGDGRVAAMALPGAPERSVALPRRPLTELLVEELRRLDADEVYGEVLTGAAPGSTPPPGPRDESTPDIVLETQEQQPATGDGEQGPGGTDPAEGSSEQDVDGHGAAQDAPHDVDAAARS
ncbi:glucose-6-phosphate dehydrogenase assembly protein OpcA [Motilibacter rhizosphaerae]|uniref:Glucose-6-phosphate dehydrogenase assembly protein OpcA n=1 Tax=Motilibacter rhizosphaerae TaxID=598652 RepID=A0A4V2F3E3_9ACTN|nr:glucose-6-phosphate dehydrogenase assembly protein OpcA [Motilibacter rhizosphaerae]RZS82813.1 glucose-6-phosphate dehydrogenase assembly protein OpcA [Motilibacter rhizosphaerae]